MTILPLQDERREFRHPTYAGERCGAVMLVAPSVVACLDVYLPAETVAANATDTHSGGI